MVHLANEVEGFICSVTSMHELMKGANWDFWVGRNEAVQQLRQRRLIGADSNEIAVTASVSAGINSLASALNFDGAAQQGGHYRFRIPNQCTDLVRASTCAVRPLSFVLLRKTAGKIPLEKIEEAAVDDETLIVATAQVAFRTRGKTGHSRHYRDCPGAMAP